MKKMRKFSFKALSILVAISVLLSTLAVGFSLTAQSQSDVASQSYDVWSGEIADSFASGSGKAHDPYIIETAEQLARLVKLGDTTGGYYSITKDIYLNDISKSDWMTNSPKSWFDRAGIGNTAFVGFVDGNGHTIHGLYYNGGGYAALFPQAKNTTISNLHIKNASLTSKYPVAALVAFGQTKVSFSGCTVDETVTVTGVTTGSGLSNPAGDAAAFIAYGSPSIVIDNCAATATVTGGANIGAFIADCWYGSGVTHKITNSFATGLILGGPKLSYTAENTYGTVTDSRANGSHTVLPSADLMKGSAAKTNMPNLNWNTWKVTDSYPTVKKISPNGTKGEVWSGAIAQEYAGGTGTEGDPYLIETPEQLARMVGYDVLTNYSGNIQNSSANKYYKLTADIYLNDVSDDKWYQKSGLNEWYSSTASRFCGNLDGDGYTIYGLYTKSDAQYCGLFPVVDAWTADRYFNDITISHSYLVTSNGSAFVGSIAGRIYSNNSKTVYFNNCYITDNVIFSASSPSTYWGGFVGFEQPSSTSFYSFTGCAVLAKTPTGCGFVGYEPASGTLTIANSFAVADKWYPKSAALSDSYLVSDIAAIFGADAKAAMPYLAWDYIWKTVEDGYPTYYSREYDLNGTVGGVWSGLTAVDYAGGTGKPTDPYKIATAEQFIKMLKDTNSEGTYYELIADIRFNDTSVADWKNNARKWSRISNRFKGSFDGNGHTVSGVYYDGNENNVALFCVAQNATIENIILDNSYIKSEGFAIGGIVGQAVGTVDLNKCYVGKNVLIESTYVGNDAGAGGMVGYGGAAIKINGCAFLGTVKAPRFAGSIAGNCWSSVTVTNTFSNSDMRFCSKMELNSASDNNYSVYKYGENRVIYLPANKMAGANAMENMSGLDWARVWSETDGYPICKFTEDTNVEAGIWSGNIATDFAGGTGTQQDPYLIENGEQLALMVTDTASADKYYKLTADIKLNNTKNKLWRFFARQWVWTSNIFEGKFDGDGHKITGLYYNGTKAKVGLFGYTKNAVISNLYIDESYLHSTGYGVGAVVGDANGGTVTLTGCYVGANVDIESTYNKGADAGAGGLIGYGGAAITVDGSAFLGKVNAPLNAGAIIGNCWAKDKLGNSANKISNSFSSSSLKFCSKQGLRYTSDNNYSAGTNAESSVVNVKASAMKGKTAIINMSKLDWGRYWKVNESGFPIPRFGKVVATPTDCWSGEIATKYAGGDGTKEKPYLISNGEQLALMITDTENEGKYYKLTKDIKLNDTKAKNWTHTAKNWLWTDNVFKGSLNGDNHTITGLYFNTTRPKVGLICYAANAEIKNLIIDNAYLHSTNYAVGTFIGDANNGSVTLSSCYVGKNVYVESAFNADSNVGAGGIVGYGAAAITAEGCAFLGTVKAPKNAGAILGNCWGKNHEGTSGLTVKNTFSTAAIKFCTKQSLSAMSADNYSAADNGEYGVYFIEASKMYGKDAKKNMPALNWVRFWKATDGYPIIDGGNYEGVKGKVWSGKIAENYAGGSGTKNDPYLIATGEQLAKLLDKVTESKGKYYKLTADIYLNDVSKKNWYEGDDLRSWFWVSTARYGNFNGHFDGDGHVIHGLYLNLEQNSSVVYTGLFPTVSDGTVIEKTGLSNAFVKVTTDNIEWQSYVGGFTGLVFFNQADEETDVNNLTRFSQCFGDSSVILNGRYAGGIVAGGPRPANIDNCYFVGQVIGERVGAIIGNTWNDFEGATVTQSYGATMAEDIFCGGRSGVQNSATSFNYVDNYTNAAGSVSGHATQISLLMMRGDSAKKNMTALDFNKIWYALPNGTPVLRIFGTTDKYSNTFDPEPIEVSFVANGGSQCETLYGNPEEKLTLPTPTREGYDFAGWYVYRELDIPFTLDYFPYFDQILYAKWTPKGVIMDFEDYPNTMYDLGYDYEYFKPGAVGYDAKYVKSGMASMHRLGLEDRNSDFLVNYEDMLTVGKKYNMSFWVNTDTDGTDVTLSLVHENFPDVYDTDSGVEEITVLSDMKEGNWVKVEYTFIARTQWLAIRTSGNASVYFEDFMIIPESDEIHPLEELPTNNAKAEEKADDSNSGILWWIIGGISAVVLLAAAVITIILIKKRKKAKA